VAAGHAVVGTEPGIKFSSRTPAKYEVLNQRGGGRGRQRPGEELRLGNQILGTNSSLLIDLLEDRNGNLCGTLVFRSVIIKSWQPMTSWSPSMAPTNWARA
jgi:hypothetical protein